MRLLRRTVVLASALAAATTALTWVGVPARTTAQGIKDDRRAPKLANPYPAECLEPVDAPDGEGLLATSERNHMSISTLDGEVIRRPSEWARLPVAWSPDARYIVEGPEGQIYSVERDRRLDRIRHRGVAKKVRWGFSPIANCILDVPARYPGALGVTVLGNDSTSHSATLLFKDGVYSFAFSPDGRQLALYMHDGARYGIYIVELSSGEVHPVHVLGPGHCCFNFAGWTADGEKVLYWARPSGSIPGGGWILEGVGIDGINEIYARTMVPDRDRLAPCDDKLFGIVGESMSSEDPELRSGLKVLKPTKWPKWVYAVDQLDATTAPACGPAGGLAVAGVKGKGANARFRMLLLGTEGEVSGRFPLAQLPRSIEWGPSGILFLSPSKERCHLWLMRDGGEPERLDTAVPCRSLEHSQSWDWSATPPDGMPVRRYLNNPRSYAVP